MENIYELINAEETEFYDDDDFNTEKSKYMNGIKLVGQQLLDKSLMILRF